MSILEGIIEKRMVEYWDRLFFLGKMRTSGNICILWIVSISNHFLLPAGQKVN
jgi:hypothetical protein